MAYHLIVTRDIKKQLIDLPGNVTAVARQSIADLPDTPRPERSKELDGHPGHYRLHIAGGYRLVWFIDDDAETVEIEYVGPKSPDLYAALDLDRTG